VNGRLQRGPKRLAPTRFVVAFAVVSMLADFVYEGARAITGPYLATFGASAALVDFVTGFGEAVALAFRRFSGRLSDRTGQHWALSIAGYPIAVVAVPVLAVTQALWHAAGLVIAEPFGKAFRTPGTRHDARPGQHHDRTRASVRGSRGGAGRVWHLHRRLRPGVPGRQHCHRRATTIDHRRDRVHRRHASPRARGFRPAHRQPARRAHGLIDAVDGPNRSRRAAASVPHELTQP
jgi:hypothetical protein